MYTSFYKLAEMPFTISTDPRFLWLGDKHREALANLNYGLVEADGYVVLTGDVGVGKTTLVNALLESVDDSILTINVSHPTLSILEFFRFVAKAWDGPAEMATKVEFLFFFEESLLKTHEEGRKVLLIIDEAHKLSEELLEEIRLLSNIEHQGIRLINIFFVGQNELKDILMNPQFRALRQRITLFYDIKPLSPGETAAYIKHRLQVAGGDGDIFSADAVAAVHSFSKGYPRLINTICGRSMLTGFIKEQQNIDAAIVEECSRELDFLDPTQVSQPIVSDHTVEAPGSAQDGEVPQRPVPLTISTQEDSRQNMQLHALRLKSKAGEKTPRPPQDKPGFSDDWRGWLQLPENAGKVIIVLILIGILGFYLIPDRNGSLAKFEMEDKEVAEITASQDISPSQGKMDKETAPPEESVSVDVEEGQNEITVESSQAGSSITEKDIGEVETASQESEESIVAMQSQEKPEASPVPAPPTTLELAIAALDNQQYQTVLDLLKAEQSPPEEQAEMYAVLYASALVGKAEQLMSTSPKEAKVLLRQVVATDDTNSRAYFLLGKLHTQDKEYAPAIDAYQKAARLNPAFPDSFFNLGFLYASIGMYENAEQFFMRAVELKPDYLGKALFNLAVIQERLGNYEESFNNLRRASELDPENEKVKSYLQRAEAKLKGQ